MIGKTISHYKILEKLGEGGMGVVYKAEDTKLKRTVALKFLSSQSFGTPEEKTRFVHEAQAAAALDHPNICTVHEIDEADGHTFIAMAYVDGQSLSEKTEAGPLKLEEALSLATDIAHGLQEAHEKNIVHRDIKSANIMVMRKGHAKITDFGLARFAGSTRLTKTGTTVGTAAYMSPEQARGEGVDHRCDIWSLGVVLYEMLTGQCPFRGDHEQAVTYQIVHEDPEPITGLRTGVPMELERIVGKCLEKKSSDRYQHVDELLVDLRKVKQAPEVKPKKKLIRYGVVILAAVVAAVLYAVFTLDGGNPQPHDSVPRIAVLPFDNLGSPEDQYFADGMTEEITSRLAGISGLAVISRTSSIKLKESDQTLREIGRDHGIDFVLEGSVRWSKVGDQHRVRITPQLIRVSDDRHMWADNYERALIEVFAVQADIAEKIVEQLGLTLVEKDRESLTSRPTENPEAYRYYLKALKELRGGSDFSNSLAAQAALDSAVTLDSTFALAHALRSEAYSHTNVGHPDSRTGRIAFDSATKSLELEPGLPQGHFALGNFYYTMERDFDRALEQYSLAKSGLANDPELLQAISRVQSWQGKYEQAAENRRRAADLDPLNARRHSELSSVLQDLRKFTEAEQSIDRAIALESTIQSYYEDKIACRLSQYGEVERIEPVIAAALQHCDTIEFVLKNSAITRYIPRLQTEAIIADFLREQMADTARVNPFDNRPFYDFEHLDILENHKDVVKRVLSPEYLGGDSFAGWQGLLLSFVGECDEAIEYGIRNQKRTTNDNCVSCVPSRGMTMARIYANCERYDEAINELEAVLSMKTYVTANTLNYKHWIDPFRDNPRFQMLMKKHE